jgi:hypothetical protein
VADFLQGRRGDAHRTIAVEYAAGGVRANCLAPGVAIWLLSDAAPFTTGATLSVEGGFLA